MHVSWRKRISRTLRGKLRARVLANFGEGIVANTKNGLLVVDPRDFNVSRFLLTRGTYDWQPIQWLSRLINEQSSLLVVGAHIGSVLIPLARGSKAQRIVALEPSPRNFRYLTMNLALNGLSSVSLLQLAAGDSTGTVRFTENRINSGNSRVSKTGEVEVQVARLDDIVDDLAEIDLLVMDTEGFEVRAMRGGLETLRRTKYFYVEYAPEQLREQGHEPQEFIELVAQRFTSMYIEGPAVQFFSDKSFVKHLSGLPPRRGLLLNLLFSNDVTPRPELTQRVR